MFAYAAIAQLAFCQFPGQVTPAPPPPPPRLNPLGTVAVVDVVPDLTYGTSPAVAAPFALIINQPFIYTPTLLSGTITLKFIAPSGKVQFSDNRYVNVNAQILRQFEQFSPPQYLVYQAAIGEFNEAGVWQVIVQTSLAQSAIYFFTLGSQ